MKLREMLKSNIKVRAKEWMSYCMRMIILRGKLIDYNLDSKHYRTIHRHYKIH